MIVYQPACTRGAQKERGGMEREPARRHYEAPKVKVLGSVRELTQQNFSNSEVDFNFAGVELTGVS